MSLRRIDVDRIVLTLEGLPVAQAELVAAQLQAAMAAQPWPLPQAAAGPVAGDSGAAPEGVEASLEVPSRLAGPALVDAVAARLVSRVGAALRAGPSHIASADLLQDPSTGGAAKEAPPWP